jgi:hypothetical protein
MVRHVREGVEHAREEEERAQGVMDHAKGGEEGDNGLGVGNARNLLGWDTLAAVAHSFRIDNEEAGVRKMQVERKGDFGNDVGEGARKHNHCGDRYGGRKGRVQMKQKSAVLASAAKVEPEAGPVAGAEVGLEVVDLPQRAVQRE